MKNKEYISKYKVFVDLILIYYIKNNFDFKLDDKIIQDMDIYFNNNYIYKNSDQIKDEIFKIYNNIIKQHEDINQINFLFKIFGFSFFEKLCFLITLFYITEEKYKLIISCLDNNNNYGVCINLIFKICQSLGFETDYLFDDLKLNILGLDREINNKKNINQKIMIISDRILAYVFKKNYIDSEIKDIINFNNFNNFNNIKLINNLETYIKNLINFNLDKNNINKKLDLLVIKGPKDSGKKTQIRYIMAKYNIHTMFVDFEFLADKSLSELEIILKKLIIEAYLSKSLICIYNFNIINNLSIKYIFLNLYKYFYFVILISENKFLDTSCLDKDKFLINSFMTQDLNELERLDFLKFFMKDSDIKLEDLEKIARGFLFRIGEIKTISEKYFLVKSVNYNKNLELLKKICLETSNYNFGNLATRVNYNFDWDDLVLEKDCKEKLLSICNRIKYKNKIYNDWNFKKQVSYGSGISALFYGPPGTGKTMAAKVIADQVGCELYKIDLSQVIDKYIGETEKNLKSIFDKASKTNVILFFDEADSIFSKRLNISSSNDRYSNIEVSYLLQKIEEYSGVSILATNFLSGFDEAFKRRINFIVNFNIPDKDSRYLIWKKSFPKEASLDENIDFIRLAEKFELTGSSIKSVAVSAAFYSLEDREDKNKKNIIKINHIKKALKDELEKNGKAFLSSDLDIY